MLRYLSPDGSEIAVKETLFDMEEATGIPAGVIYKNIIRTRTKLKAGVRPIKPYFIDDEPYRRKSNKDVAFKMFDEGASEQDVMDETGLKRSTVHEYYLTWTVNTGKSVAEISTSFIPGDLWMDWERTRQSLLRCKADLSKIKLQREI